MSDMVLPGDKIALIEECEAGKNSYDDDGLIRSMIVGKSEMNKKERLIDVENQKVLSVPKTDDIIIGTIEMVTPSMIISNVLFVQSILSYSILTYSLAVVYS